MQFTTNYDIYDVRWLCGPGLNDLQSDVESLRREYR